MNGSGQKGIYSILMTRIRQNHYNKINFKLKSYHEIFFDLYQNGLNKINSVDKLAQNVIKLNYNFKEIKLSLDEMIDDLISVGLHTFAQAYNNFLDIVTTMHDTINIKIKLNSANQYSNYQKFKNTDGYCIYCKQNYQVRNIKNLKNCLGMNYPSDQQDNNLTTPSILKQDYDIKQKEQFITMIDNILDKRNNIKNIKISNKYYKQLMQYLSKINRINIGQDKIMLNKNNIKQKQNKNNIDIKQENQTMQYKKIIQEIKYTLNQHYNFNYPTKIKNLMEKYQFLIKTQNNQNVIQKRMRNQEVQTNFWTQQIQLKITKNQVKKIENELQFLKQNKKVIEEKYMKILQSQRKIHHSNSTLILKCSQYQNALEEKDKIVTFLKKQLKALSKQFKLENYIFSQDQMKKQQGLYRSGSFQRQMKISQYQKSKNNKKDQQTQVQQFKYINDKNAADHPSQKRIKLNKSIQGFNKKYFNQQQTDRPLQKQSQTNLKLFDKVISITLYNTKLYQKQSSRLDLNEQVNIHQKDIEDVKTINKGDKKNKLNKTTKQKINKNNSDKLKHPYIKAIQKTEEIFMKNPINQTFDNQNNKTFSSTNRWSKNKDFLKSNSTQRFQRRPSKMNILQLQQINQKYIQLNPLKNDLSNQPYDKNYHNNDQNTHHKDHKEKDIKIRINKITKRNTSFKNKEKVAQIANLLKMKRSNKRQQSKFKSIFIQQTQVDDFPKDDSFSSEKNYDKQDKNSINSLQLISKHNVLINNNIEQEIEELKLLIQAQYTYLKATGFLDYLLKSLFNKNISNVDRSLIKYKFQFTKIEEKDIDIFGGNELMVKFSHNAGIWEKYDNQHEIKIYTKYKNFAQKIGKYFGLLKKINLQYFEEYISFLKDPYSFSLNNFSNQIVHEINILSKHLHPNGQTISRPTQKQINIQINIQNIFMKIIRFHYENHKKCSHLIDFLQKIGFYRYAL